MQLKILAFTYLALLLLAPCAGACQRQPQPAVNCSSTVTSAFDNHGRLWLAYTVDDQIWIVASADLGQSFTQPVAVNHHPESISARGENRPKLIVNDHHVLVSWARSGSKRFTADIRFSASRDGGKTFSEPRTLNRDGLEIGHSFNEMVIDSHQRLHIAWLDGRERHAAAASGESFTGSSLFYTWSDDWGEQFANETSLSQHTCECCRLAMTTAPDADPWISWRQIDPSRGVRDHALARINQAEAALRVLPLSNENWRIDGCPHHGPDLTMDTAHQVHAVWFSGDEQQGGLWYRHIDTTKSTLPMSPPQRFATLDQQAAHPQVISVGDQVVRAWSAYDGESNLIYTQTSSDGGKTWSNRQTQLRSQGAIDYPFLISDGDTVYLSWLTTAEGYRLVALKQPG
ncbi:MAG: sialidase family protein [Wenzhouxiangellaceae bacterium]